MKKGLSKRIIAAKFLGVLIGLIGFCVLPKIWNEADMMIRLGILFWYINFGVLIGLMGFVTEHPMFPSIKFPVWFRGIFMGSWLNFVLVFFAYEKVEAMLLALDWGIYSPWWLILEGAILGLIIDLVITKYGGEGKDLLK